MKEGCIFFDCEREMGASVPYCKLLELYDSFPCQDGECLCYLSTEDLRKHYGPIMMEIQKLKGIARIANFDR